MTDNTTSWLWSDVLTETKRWSNYDDGTEYDLDDDDEPVPVETVVGKFPKVAGRDEDELDAKDTVELALDLGRLEKVDGGVRVPTERRDMGDEERGGGAQRVTDGKGTAASLDDVPTWGDVAERLGLSTDERTGRHTFTSGVEVLTRDGVDGDVAVTDALDEGLLDGDADGNVWLTEDCLDEPVAPPTDAVGDSTALDDGRVVVDREVYPDEIQERDIWVSWALDDEGRKRPRAPWKRGDCYPCEWHGDLDDDERPETTFDEARRYAQQRGADLENIGLAFPETDPEKSLGTGIILPVDRPPRHRRITLIDWDDVRDPETDEVHPTCLEYLRKIGGYAEVSQSGKGIHQFVIGGLRGMGKLLEEIDDEPVGDLDDLPMVEIYDGGQHVAMTGRHVAGTGDDVVEGQKYIDELCVRFDDGVDDEEDLERHDDKLDPEDVDVNLDDIDAPDDMPECYRRIMEARVEDNADYSSGHDLNLHAAILGACAGYSVEDVIGHFMEYPPDGVEAELDKGIIEKAVVGTFEKIQNDDLNPVGVSTLRKNGVFGDGETCDPDCPIHGDNGILSRPDAERHDVFDTTLVEDAGIFEDLTDVKRYLRKRGELPTTADVRRRIDEEVKDSMKRGKSVVLDAPTAAGKSHAVATTPWRGFKDVTDGQPVVHLHKTKEARREAYDESRAANVAARELVGRKDKRRGCPIARGDFDDEVEIEGVAPSVWIDHACDAKGLPFSLVHAEAVKRIEENAPGLLDEHGAACPDCPPVTQHEGVPRNDDGEASLDVIHATHQFGYVPSYLVNCNVVVDEEPDYRVGLSRDRVRRAVTAFLQEVDAPLDTFERLLVGRGNEHLEIGEEKVVEALEREPSKSWYFECDAAHAYAPALARAVWYANDAGNGRKRARVYHEPPRFDENDDRGLGCYVTLVLDETPRRDGEEDATVYAVPNFNAARSVIGLDARPCMETWALNTAPDIDHDSVLDFEERRNWRFFERGLRVVQVGDATRPVGGDGEHFDDDGERAVLETLVEKYGDVVRTVGTGKAVENDAVEILKEAREERGYDPETVESLHYGEEKSRNVPAFADASVGYVTHCIDPGDDFVLDVIAARGLDARPERSGECDECDGDGCHGCDGTGYKRAHGRGFVGEDADKAADILGSVRENHVAQMTGRYARNPEDDDVTVTFTRTDACPDDLVDAKAKDVVWTYGEKQKAVVEYIRETDGRQTAREIRNGVADRFDDGVSKQHVAETLRRVEAYGDARREREAGDNGADVWTWTGDAGALTDTGVIDLSTEETNVERIVNSDVWCNYTWDFAVCPPKPLEGGASSSTAPSRPDSGGVDPGGNSTLDAFGAD